MPVVHFLKPLFKPITANADEILMQVLLDGGVPVASSCHGDGVCTKCKLQILEGIENLEPLSELEKDLRRQHSIPDNFRVSCQVKLKGDVKVTAAYW